MSKAKRTGGCSLSRQLSTLFAPKQRPPAMNGRQFKGQRERARALAGQYGIEIEPMSPGMNVWPPAGVADVLDPFDGDHYAQDWADALARVEAYVEVLKGGALANP